MVALALSAGSLALLITAANLSPSPSGVGSHRGLGLASCSMLDRTGIPCPGCGMTTSFTWFVRGNLLASLYVQPMGTLLALIAAVSVWGGGYVALTGRPIHHLLQLVPARLYILGLFGLALSAWGWKVFIHLKGLDGW